MNTYTITDYHNAITREIEKRKVAYPKMLDKKSKEWVGIHGYTKSIAFSNELRVQMENLVLCRLNLELTFSLKSNAIFRELQRELRLRKQLYPRWVRWGRMTQESADMELSVWQSLTEYWHENYCPDIPWRKPPTRKKECPICGTLTNKGQQHPVEGWLCNDCLPEPQDFTQ